MFPKKTKKKPVWLEPGGNSRRIVGVRVEGKLRQDREQYSDLASNLTILS